ncbi:acyl-CoA dehydrogenase [Variovorax sp. N23]|uniref:acyl-CoA dehydrogenase n=1 Tax=Variovorax sp. N23 TaxID=2980555 RepID=UPI0021C9E302|nr:acyl-CoA dehydrogenase [Variovorax sp. N23]MCU4122372.1 acyl-CoA dehydrogenase family protein [Variovorax sp. N23]
MFVEAVRKILQAEVTPAYVRSVEQSGQLGQPWDALEEAGFLDLLVPEGEGGAGMELSDLYAICHLQGSLAAPMPLVNTLIARKYLGAAGRHSMPHGPIGLASTSACSKDGALVCAHLPFGAVVKHVLVVTADATVLLETEGASVTSAGIWCSQLASLAWPAGYADKSLSTDCPPQQLQAFAAASYAGMLCGAMEKVFQMTLQHCNDREQFGKSLGKFQAVQHQLAVMAEHIVAASLATQAAFGEGNAPPLLRAAIAKGRASEAALLVANTAHALHGAVGITAEYDLQLYTRRLHEWRMAHGSEAFWHRWLGTQVLASQGTFCDFVQAT